MDGLEYNLRTLFLNVTCNKKIKNNNNKTLIKIFFKYVRGSWENSSLVRRKRALTQNQLRPNTCSLGIAVGTAVETGKSKYLSVCLPTGH